MAGAGVGLLAVTAGATTVAEEMFDALAAATGDATICRGASEAGAFVSFIGVNMAVKAISLLASGAAIGAGAGNCGAPVTVVLGALAVEVVCVGAGGAGVPGAATGATIAVRVGRSAMLRGCFFASAAVGIGEELFDSAGKLPNMD